MKSALKNSHWLRYKNRRLFLCGCLEQGENRFKLIL